MEVTSRCALLLLVMHTISSAFFTLVTICLTPSVCAAPAVRQSSRKNIILGWTDGMGSSVLPMTRQYVQMLENQPELEYNGYVTSLEDDFIGVSRTGSLITDSAAGATAVSCGIKTINGRVGVDSAGAPVGTILEAAKAAGYLTGVISTSYIWDASPAAFTAHSVDRNDAWFIAAQQLGLDNPLGRSADLILGGGLCAFIPQSEAGSCRFDDRDLLAEASAEYGWNIALNSTALASADSLPLVGLFAPEDIACPLDRLDTHPSLPDMVDKALELLHAATAASDKGFFLFYESEITDSAQHDNDLVATISGALEISDTAMKVKGWVDRLQARGDDTLFFSTSDHETGGLGLGARTESPIEDWEYGWNPFVLANASHSTYYTAGVISEAAGEGPVTAEQIRTIVAENLNLFNFTTTEASGISALGNDTDALNDALAIMVNIRARLDWTTSGHTAADVPIYCYTANNYCLNFRGSNENTDLTDLMEAFLGDVDIASITHKLFASGFNVTAPDMGSNEE